MKHSISPVEDNPIAWECSCGAEGFDIFDLISHANEIITPPFRIDSSCWADEKIHGLHGLNGGDITVGDLRNVY